MKNEMLNLLNNALNATSMRQETISNNISNVNTRNYKAKRVSFEDAFKKALDGSHASMSITDNQHIGMSSNIGDIQARVVEDEHTEMRLDGNNVDIDVEMANLAANQLMYNALVQQANNKISTLRYIISEGKR